MNYVMLIESTPRSQEESDSLRLHSQLGKSLNFPGVKHVPSAPGKTGFSFIPLTYIKHSFDSRDCARS